MNNNQILITRQLPETETTKELRDQFPDRGLINIHSNKAKPMMIRQRKSFQQ